MNNKRLLPGLATVTVLLLIFGCVDDGKKAEAAGKAATRAETAKPASGGATLSSDLDLSMDYSYGSIESKDDSIVLSLEPVEVATGVSLEKKFAYTRNDGGTYSGELTLHFTSTGSKDMRYVETIPKSFASDVNSLTFSIQPDEIVQADPVIAWNRKVDGSLDIKVASSEDKKPDEAAASVTDGLVEGSLDACRKLSDEESLLCQMEIARKYRDNGLVQTYVKDLKPAQGPDALILAVVYKNPEKYCGRLEEQESLLCRRYAFAMYVKDCDEGPAAEKADCIRKSLWEINDRKTIMDSCEHITDPELREECMGSVETSYCEKITDASLRNKCLVHLAGTKGDASICKKVIDAELKDICNYHISKDKKDPSICDNIKNAEGRDECIAQIALSMSDPSICDRIKDRKTKEMCITTAAISAELSDKGSYFMSTGICDKMKENEEALDLCYSMVAARTLNADLCDNVKDEVSRDVCLFAFALTNDSSYCDRMKTEWMRDACVKFIAEETKDAEMCENIEDEDMKAECLKDLGENKEEKKEEPAVVNSECPVAVPNDAKKTTDSSGQPSERFLLNGKNVGPYTVWFDSAKTKKSYFACFDLDGKEHGPSMAWMADGTKSYEKYYVHGLLEGPYKEWRQGILTSDGQYKAGKKEGLWKDYLTSGELSSEQNYKADGLDGTQKYYYASGQLSKEETFSGGKWAGYKIEYQSDGKRISEWKGTNAGNKFSGTYIDWYGNTECRYESGEIVKCDYMS